MRIKRSIKTLRPPLRKVAPLTFWICVGFAFVNVFIFWLLNLASNALVRETPVPIAPSGFAFELWAYWFLFLGVGMFYTIFRNNWKALKSFLTMGLLSKLIWTYGLLFVIAAGYNVYATTMLWAFLAWVQAWTIVYFTPTINIDKHELLPENEVKK